MESLILVGSVALIGALFAYSLVKVWRNAAQHEEPPPFMSALRSAGQAEPDMNPEMAVALRRCTFCSSTEICRQTLAKGLPIPDHCPNAGFLASVRNLHAA